MKALFALSVLTTTMFAAEVGDWGRCVVLDFIGTSGQSHVSCLMRSESKEQNYTLLDFIHEKPKEALSKEILKLSSDLKDKMLYRQVLVGANVFELTRYVGEYFPNFGVSVGADIDRDATRAYETTKNTIFLLKKVKTGMYKILVRHEGGASKDVFQQVRAIVAPPPPPEPDPIEPPASGVPETKEGAD